VTSITWSLVARGVGLCCAVSEPLEPSWSTSLVSVRRPPVITSTPSSVSPARLAAWTSRLGNITDEVQ
jgi:hypothetical protein